MRIKSETWKKILLRESQLWIRREINNDIKKKVEENHAFNIKLNHLKDDVVKTQQIIDLDEDVEKADEIGYTGEEHKPGVVPNKSLEIAEVSKLKSIVKNYYEENNDSNGDKIAQIRYSLQSNNIKFYA